MPFNTAAWQPPKRGKLVVKPAPYTPPRENEIVVRNRAVAINPVDWMMQAIGDMMFRWVKYPFILGTDVAGEVAEIGKDVTRFKVGDRVLGHAMGGEPSRNTAAEGAFQIYTVLLDHMASPIPDAVSFEQAAVLPLAVSTASCGLFQKDQLALDYPTVPPRPKDKTLIVWGGSTSVGSCAIQLAVAAGYEVITTASPKNFDYVRRLGASGAFDYNSRTVVRDIVAACKGKTVAGALAIGSNSVLHCIDIVGRCKGARFVSIASPMPVSMDTMREGVSPIMALLPQLPKLAWYSLMLRLKTRAGGVRTKTIWGGTLGFNEVGRIIYVDFLPKALATGQFVPAPEPLVVGQGLAYVQAAFDAQRQGVSAKKVVVSLEG